MSEEPAVVVDVQSIPDSIGIEGNDHVQCERTIPVAAEAVSEVMAERNGLAGLDQRRRL